MVLAEGTAGPSAWEVQSSRLGGHGGSADGASFQDRAIRTLDRGSQNELLGNVSLVSRAVSGGQQHNGDARLVLVAAVSGSSGKVSAVHAGGMRAAGQSCPITVYWCRYSARTRGLLHHCQRQLVSVASASARALTETDA